MFEHFLQNVRRIIGFIVYALVDFLASAPQTDTSRKTVLLVRVDVLGDYLLFRNFIKELRQSRQFEGYKVTYCGNQALKEFVVFFDGHLFDDFIWLDRDRFAYNLPYRFRLLRRIRSQGFEVAINSQYSREFFHGDAIVRASKAVKRVGSTGDLNNLARWQKSLADRYYTWLIPADSGTLFEFFRNRDFFAQLLQTKITLTKPNLDTGDIPPLPLPSRQYLVIHPGARVRYRQWRPENFAAVAEFVYEQYGLDIVIVGNNEESGLAQTIANNYRHNNITDLTGKTDLIKLAKVIADARLFIGNDTGTAHMAAAVNTPMIIISNGNHFGRYIPYPPEVYQDARTVLPEALGTSPLNNDYLADKYRYCSNIDINTITPDAVIKVIRAYFAKN